MMVKSGCSLLVRNLRFETSPAKVRRAFERFGGVRDVYLPLDHDTGKPRGFGFVEFVNHRDAREAQRILDKGDLDGSEVNVIIAQDRRKSPESMRRLQVSQSRYRDKGDVSRNGGRDDYRDRYERGHKPYDSRRDSGYSRSRSPPLRRRQRRSVSVSQDRDYRRRTSRSNSFCRSRDSPRYEGGARGYCNDRINGRDDSMGSRY